MAGGVGTTEGTTGGAVGSLFLKGIDFQDLEVYANPNNPNHPH